MLSWYFSFLSTSGFTCLVFVKGNTGEPGFSNPGWNLLLRAVMPNQGIHNSPLGRIFITWTWMKKVLRQQSLFH